MVESEVWLRQLGMEIAVMAAEDANMELLSKRKAIADPWLDVYKRCAVINHNRSTNLMDSGPVS
jgi:hypothetical protein